MTSPFSNNTAKSRFEYAVNGAVATADYRLDGQTLYINKVEAPMELRGTGAAGKLMQEVVGYARAENLKIVPVCGYAASWIAKNTPKPPQPRL